jgi:hypothetical protein
VRKFHRLGSAKPAFERQAARLAYQAPFQATLLFIPFLAVVVLTMYTSLETSPRLHGVARPLERDGVIAPEREVWLSVGIKNEMIVVATPDGETFTWPAKGPKKEQMVGLEAYLLKRSHSMVEDAVRRGQLDGRRNVAALSVDQSLTYHHVRPIIYALAEAGFSRYGFETRVVH